MLKFYGKMRKSGKNQKAFTLIELIVVIAILGILAAIAIPRMAGFTDKAKEANDKELASIAAHTIQTLYASGDLEPVAETLTITKAAAAPATYAIVTAGNYVGTAATFQAAMEELIGTDDNLGYYTSVNIYFTATGDIDLTKGTKNTGYKYNK